MDPFVFAAVLVAAAFHASWNALIKIRLDPFLAIALFTAVTICCYSLVDGIGARTAGNAHSYALWLFVIDGAFISGIALISHGPGVIPGMARHWRSGLIGGVLSLTAYWIVIWAM